MSNLVSFPTRKVKKNIKTKINPYSFNIEEEVNKDIAKLAEKLGIDKEEAYRVAIDFYRAYPVLMEWVRSPETQRK